jgi:MarR family transcriptional regulator, transcriptional regulator for hemolysin
VTEQDDDRELEFIRECVLLGRRWRAKVDEGLKPSGLTLARSTVLYWLTQLPAVVTQRELADIVGIEGPTLVRQLHALEAQGLIVRVPMPNDRRAKGIKLTEAAAPVLDALRNVTDELIEVHFARIDRRRMSGATRVLREVRVALD